MIGTPHETPIWIVLDRVLRLTEDLAATQAATREEQRKTAADVVSIRGILERWEGSWPRLALAASVIAASTGAGVKAEALVELARKVLGL